MMRCLQLVVVATDGGGVSVTSTAIITVERNLNDPSFSQLTYTRVIEENFPLATSVVQILASDSDILVSERRSCGLTASPSHLSLL